MLFLDAASSGALLPCLQPRPHPQHQYAYTCEDASTAGPSPLLFEAEAWQLMDWSLATLAAQAAAAPRGEVHAVGAPSDPVFCARLSTRDRRLPAAFCWGTKSYGACAVRPMLGEYCATCCFCPCCASGPGEGVAAAQAGDSGTGGAPRGKRRRQQQQDLQEDAQQEGQQLRKRRRQGRDGQQQEQAAAGNLPPAVAAWRHHLLPELRDRAHWWPATAFSVPPHLYGLYQPPEATVLPCQGQEQLDDTAAGGSEAAGLGAQEDEQRQQLQQQVRLALEDLFPLGRLCVPDPALLTHVCQRARVAAFMLGPHNMYTRHVACELALLQQGLLDERAVLEAYRTTWPAVLERPGAQEGGRQVGVEQGHEPGPSSRGRWEGTGVWRGDVGSEAWGRRLAEEDEAIERRLLAVGAALGEVQAGVRLAQGLAERLAPAAAAAEGGGGVAGVAPGAAGAVPGVGAGAGPGQCGGPRVAAHLPGALRAGLPRSLARRGGAGSGLAGAAGGGVAAGQHEVVVVVV